MCNVSFLGEVLYLLAILFAAIEAATNQKFE